jgi:hypothetical protein
MAQLWVVSDSLGKVAGEKIFDIGKRCGSKLHGRHLHAIRVRTPSLTKRRHFGPPTRSFNLRGRISEETQSPDG